jgi:hypothetical protein
MVSSMSVVPGLFEGSTVSVVNEGQGGMHACTPDMVLYWYLSQSDA